jgi:hypothetical protein
VEPAPLLSESARAANAAPSPVVNGPGWAPPPPDYGYGGYGGPPCVSGPLGLLQFCP